MNESLGLGENQLTLQVLTKIHSLLYTSLDAGHLGVSLSEWYMDYNMDGYNGHYNCESFGNEVPKSALIPKIINCWKLHEFHKIML